MEKELLNDYLNHLKLSGMGENTELSRHTVIARECAITQLFEAFENPLDVTTAQLRDWILMAKDPARHDEFINKLLEDIESEDE